MKCKINLLAQLKTLPHFTKSTIYQLGMELGLKDSTIDTYISRFLKYKEIISLKNGLYVATEFFEKNRSDLSYVFYLANISYTPSYISSWTALQYYNLTTEAIYTISSVGTKTTRNFPTKSGNFSYQSINKNLFSDYLLVTANTDSKSGNFDFFIASPAKALYDLLYYKTHQFRGVSLDDIKKLINDLRIDFEEMDKPEQDKFYAMIKKLYE